MNAPVARILILDDEFHIRNALCRFLEQAGFEVDSAENGRKGLELLAGREYDLAISDILMPEMNGIAFLEHARSLRPEMDVILVTGYGNTATAVDAMKKGAADFITKPYQFTYVESVVRGLLEKRQSRTSQGHDAVEDGLYKDKIEELATLYMISESLDNVEGIESVFELIVRVATQVSGAELAAAYLIDERAAGLNLHSVYPKEKRVSRVLHAPLLAESASVVHGKREPARYYNPTGLRFLDAFLLNPGESRPAALLAPIIVRGQDFGMLCLEGKKNAEGFTEQDVGFINIILKKAAVMIERSALYESIYENMVSSLTSLVRTLEAKDRYTRFHSDRVTALAIMVAQEMGCNEQEKETLRFAGLLHDVGKIGVSDAILQKEGPLTPEEFEAIKSHPVIGDRILEPLQMLPEERAIIRHHHERWDGKGYPDKLGGKEIPLLVRVVSLADSYDAMTSDRVYRLGLPHDTAVGEIIRNAGRQFDPNVVRAFESICRRHPHDLILQVNNRLDPDKRIYPNQSIAI